MSNDDVPRWKSLVSVLAGLAIVAAAACGAIAISNASSDSSDPAPAVSR